MTYKQFRKLAILLHKCYVPNTKFNIGMNWFSRTNIVTTVHENGLIQKFIWNIKTNKWEIEP